MKKWLSALSVLLAVALLTASAGFAAPSGKFIQVQGDKIPGEYIVVFNDDAINSAESAAIELSAAHLATVGDIWEDALRGAVFRMSERQAIKLAEDPRVRFVEENGLVTGEAFQFNPPSWGLDRIDQRNLPLDNTYGFTATGGCVRVYIIDSGIRPSHVDFGGRVDLANSANFSTLAPTAPFCHGHGTHVAATAGGAQYGVAKGVILSDVQVLNCNNVATWAEVINGVNFVTQNHTKHCPCPSVANMSLGGGISVALDAAVVNSINSGVTYVLSAGNSSANAALASPARVGGTCGPAITVGASDINDNWAGFSNFGTCVDLEAPGVNIPSAWNTSDNATAVLSGTSMSAPHVTGVAALYLAGNLNATPAQVKAAINAGATPGVISGVPFGTPNRLLYSLINSCPGP